MSSAAERRADLEAIYTRLRDFVLANGTTFIVRDDRGDVARVCELPQFRQLLAVARMLERPPPSAADPSLFDANQV